jgi:hypothetical protein
LTFAWMIAQMARYKSLYCAGKMLPELFIASPLYG